jgi:hypothetical protein
LPNWLVPKGSVTQNMAWNGIKIVFVFVHSRLHIKKNIMTFFCYPGITGCPLQAYIFMGPIYYQKLKHMVRPCAYFIMYQNSKFNLPSSLLPERDYLSAWGFSFDIPLMQQVHDLRFQHMLVCHFFYFQNRVRLVFLSLFPTQHSPTS